MKIAALISRYLLGLQFLVAGLNGFLHFFPMKSMGASADKFIGAMVESHYIVPIFLLQLIGAVLLLINRYVPLALTLLAPIIVNIVLFHLLMAPEGLVMALVVTVLWMIVAWQVRSAFAGILQLRVQS